MVYSWDFGAVLADPLFWIQGVLITLAYGLGTVAAGSVIGLILGVLSLASTRWLTWPIGAFVQVFRYTPLLVQIVWFYYALPIVLNVDLPAWLAAGIGLTLYMGAFCVEIFRAGIISVEAGQWQAARALGLKQFPMYLKVVLPQAIRRMTGPLVNQSVMQMKNTALLYVVAVPDLMYRSSIMVTQTFRPLESYTVVAILYFIILLPMGRLARYIEVRSDT